MASDYGVPTVYGGFLQGLAGMQEQQKHESDMLTAQQARKESEQIMTLRSLQIEDEQRKAQIAKATQEAILQKAQADAAAAAQKAEVDAMDADTQIWIDQGKPLQEKLDQYIQAGKLPKGTLATQVPNPWVPGGKPLWAIYNPSLGLTQDQAIIFNEPYARAKYGEEVKGTAQARSNLNEMGLSMTADGRIVKLPGAELIPAKTAPSTTVNVNTAEAITGAGEKAATVKFGEGVGAKAQERIAMAEEGAAQNAQLDRLALALSSGADTGPGSEILLNLKSVASTFGLDVSKETSEQEVIRKITNEMALRLRNPESGLGLTGNTSNMDLLFLKSSIPGLQRTKQGNLAIIEAAKRTNKMKADIAQYQNSIISANGGVVPLNLDNQVLEYVNKYKMYSEEERGSIKRVSEVTKDPSEMTDDEIKSSLGIK